MGILEIIVLVSNVQKHSYVANRSIIGLGLYTDNRLYKIPFFKDYNEYYNYVYFMSIHWGEEAVTLIWVVKYCIG